MIDELIVAGQDQKDGEQRKERRVVSDHCRRFEQYSTIVEELTHCTGFLTQSHCGGGALTLQ